MNIEIKAINPKRRKPLFYISFIKFIAMILIIKWHIIPWKRRPIDYGARMCEILFIASGFLVGYNYYQKSLPCTFFFSFKYVYRHLRAVYPLIFINTLYRIFFYLNNKPIKLLDIEVFTINILMMVPWSRYYSFTLSLNGISWFISIIYFCYFLTPFLLFGIKNIKVSLILLLTIDVIRISIEEFICKGATNILDINFHFGPIIRCMEFYLGMLLIPLYFKLKYYLDKMKNYFMFKMFFSFIQVILVIFIHYLMLKYNNILYRCYFIQFSLIFIFITGYDYGYLSNIFSITICRKIMSCQVEMYLMQITIDKTLKKSKAIIYLENQLNREILFLIKLIIIFGFSFIYILFFKERFAKYMDKVSLFFYKIFSDNHSFNFQSN